MNVVFFSAVLRQFFHKPKFHLARHVSTRHDTTRHARVEPTHFRCVELVEQHGSTHWTRSSRLARHVERVVSRLDVTSQMEFRLYWPTSRNRNCIPMVIAYRNLPKSLSTTGPVFPPMR